MGYSTDHGVTWAAADLRVDKSTARVDNDFAVHCDGTNVIVAWGDDRLNDSAIFFNSSTP